MRKLQWISIVLLLAGAAGLGWKLRSDARRFSAANDPAAQKARPMVPAQPPSQTQAPDYMVVAQQNPFHPERNNALPPPPAEPVKASGPPPLVYGSMLLDKEKYALMATESDPKPRKVVEGDEFYGYKLAEVKPQSVILENGGSKSEVMFYNALSRLRRDTQKTSGGTGAAAPAGATVTNTGSTPMAPTGVMAAVADNTPPPPPVGAAPPPGKVWVQTPFGPILQDKK
jgi:hypothetical protein